MKDLIIVRGGGDIATGTIYKLVKSGFHVLILEIAHPSAIRRNVAFSEAVYEEKWQVEDMTCHLAHDIKEAEQIMKAGNPALMIDPNGEMIKQLHPIAVVDAILAKKNLGTTRDMAPITIALGPGFTAGKGRPGSDPDYLPPFSALSGDGLQCPCRTGNSYPNHGARSASPCRQGKKPAGTGGYDTQRPKTDVLCNGAKQSRLSVVGRNNL